MPLTTISCPECGAALSSAAGYSVGRTATCSKCQAEFLVADPAQLGGRDELGGGPAGPAWSYRTSNLRTVVLLGLVAVMGVLGYLLYEKKMKERDDARAAAAIDADTGDAPVIDGSKIKLTPALDEKGNPKAMPTAPAPVGGLSGGPARSTFFPADDINKRLTGTWEWAGTGETATLVYAADGKFTYTATGPAAKTVSGTWSVGKVERPSEPDPVLVLPMQWTADGQALPNAQVGLAGDKLQQHPLIHKTGADAKTGGTFTRKK